MADLQRKPVLPWLENELARQLTPVAAPDSLWDRINQPRPRRQSGISLEWAFWPLAAAMVLLTFAGVLRAPGAHDDPSRITDREIALLANSLGPLDLHSDDFEETRMWVKSHANIDIDVPSGQAPADHGAVRLLGARLIRLHGLPVAAIDYRVGDQTATLFVSGKNARLSGEALDSKHLFSRIDSAGGVRIASWNMRSQTYAIAFSGAQNARGACLLCHATSPGVLVFGLNGIN